MKIHFHPHTLVLLLVFNIFLVFLPIAGFLYANVFERELLKSQENSMATQAKLFAASLTEFPLKEGAEKILKSFKADGLSRLRVFDLKFLTLADSADFAPKEEVSKQEISKRETQKIDEPEIDSTKFALPALDKALKNDYGAWTVVSAGQRSVTLYIAVPIYQDGQKVGLVLASQSTLKILESLYHVRDALLKIFIISIVFAVFVSIMLTLTIVLPLRRLQRMARTFIQTESSQLQNFKPIWGPMEIHNLSNNLTQLGSEVQNHLNFFESFSRDLLHEARNPLATIKTASELVTKDNVQLGDILKSQVERLERLFSQIQNFTRIESELAKNALETIELEPFFRNYISKWNIGSPRIQLKSGGQLFTKIRPGFFEQALDVLIENAISFSPVEKPIEIEIFKKDEDLVICILDSGPGVAPENLALLTKRFFTTRRDATHSGIGLAIAHAIISFDGGNLEFQNRPEGGLEVRIKTSR